MYLKPLPTREYLVSIGVAYDPLTGVITCNGSVRKVGAAGQVRLAGSHFTAHRIAWVMMTGIDPPFLIDHWNGVDNDNRWENLRPATSGQNNTNFKRRNKHPHPGVRFKFGMWYSHIKHLNVDYPLGKYKTLDEALDVRFAAERLHHGEHAYSNRPGFTRPVASDYAA